MMKLFLIATCSYLLGFNQVFAQKNRTITYHHFYQIHQFQNKQAYSFDAYGALVIQNDTLSIYRLSKEEKGLTKSLDLCSEEANLTYVQSLTTMKVYNVSNLNSEHIFVENTTDTSKWEILADRDTILNIPCIAAYKDSTLAWYAPSMPLPVGPFGVVGLSGTILKIYNLKYQYILEATSILDTIPSIIRSKRMFYMTDEMFRKRNIDLYESKSLKKVKWFWQR